MSLRVMYEVSVWMSRSEGLKDTVAGRWKVNRRFLLSFLRINALKINNQMKHEVLVPSKRTY